MWPNPNTCDLTTSCISRNLSLLSFITKCESAATMTSPCRVIFIIHRQEVNTRVVYQDIEDRDFVSKKSLAIIYSVRLSLIKITIRYLPQPAWKARVHPLRYHSSRHNIYSNVFEWKDAVNTQMRNALIAPKLFGPWEPLIRRFLKISLKTFYLQSRHRENTS